MKLFVIAFLSVVICCGHCAAQEANGQQSENEYLRERIASLEMQLVARTQFLERELTTVYGELHAARRALEIAHQAEKELTLALEALRLQQQPSNTRTVPQAISETRGSRNSAGSPRSVTFPSGLQRPIYLRPTF
jgi:hypothetical protein